MKTFFRDNLMIFIWAVLAVFIELFSVTFTDCKPYISAPLYALLLLFFFFVILLMIPSKKAKFIVATVILFLHIALCVALIYLYDSNGTMFDFSMIKMRMDARGTIEEFSLNPLHLSICLVLWVAFLIGGIVDIKLYKKHNVKKFVAKKPYNLSLAIACVLIIVFVTLFPMFKGMSNEGLDYMKLLYKQNLSVYQTKGMTANAVYEMFGGSFASKVDTDDLTKVTNALNKTNPDLYLETSDMFGVSRGNNLVVIMVESLDWYPLNLYLSAEKVREVYPNLAAFMDQGIVLSGYHTREKTDTSENNALLGGNPTKDKYINYDFENNTYPYSLVNMFKNAYPDAKCNAFHQNTGSFYNRRKLFKSYGFEKYYDIEAMKAYGVKNDYGTGLIKGDRNKDSDAMSKMVSTMFPTDQQFLTYWLTYSMHGFYKERKNLGNFTYKENGVNYKNGYYGYLDKKGIFPKGNGKKEDYLRTYAAALKDFDVAVGIMMNYLRENNLLDHTTIVMYSDHNTYYNSLAKYAKKINTTFSSPLYNIPAMIYDQKLTEAYASKVGENSKQVVYGNDNNQAYKCYTVSKFTTTQDVIPTVFDIFGIVGYNDLYVGNSIFTDKESIVYSRAYGIFLTDKVMGFSANKLLYTCPGFTKADMDSFILRAEDHLRKREITDKIFYSNYFATHKYVYPTNP